ncbi:MAG: S8 family serine peptidase [Novosphingobium sp.]
MSRMRWIGHAAIVALAVSLSGCGGGGGVSSTPAPAPAPTPTPTPVPTPTSTPTPTATNFDTAEYRRSDGPSLHNAVTAWQAGANGAGTTIAIVDSGIDTANTEFAGRISSASRDVAGTRQLTNADDAHGTQVALTAAAARNNSGVMGIAWNATVQMLRADTPGSCTGADGCSFSDENIAAGIDAAVTAGARVINLSLGGDPGNATLRAAVGRAATAGVVVIVSAGNEGQSTDPAIDPANPDPFAVSVLQAGSGNVIIVGSVNSSGLASGFSNKAGTSAASVLMAQGEEVCCVYEGSTIKTTTNAQGTFVTLVNGTSFAAPQVSGAVALLAQAFPNLTGTQIVDLLLRTARDAGTAGTDAVYGRGILDIARAFAPQGSTGLAGTQVAVSLDALTATTSGAMGDALQGASLVAVMLDGYERAYSLDLAAGFRVSRQRLPLYEGLSGGQRPVSIGAPGMSLAFSVDRRFGVVPLRLAPGEVERARVLTSSVFARLGRSATVAAGWRVAADDLVAQLQGWEDMPFVVAGRNDGVLARPETALATRYRLDSFGLGNLALTFSGERGMLLRNDPRQEFRADWMRRVGIMLDGGAQRGLGWRVGVDLMREDHTVLGARFADALGGGGATTTTLSTALDWKPARNFRIAASGNLGLTSLDKGAVVMAGSRLTSSSWTIDISRRNLVTVGDRLAFRIAQPMRIESGGLQLNLPLVWDYETRIATFTRVPLSLAPKGRELDAELAWATALWGGDASASVFFRREPGHFANAPDDGGVAVRWSRGF